LAADIGFEVIDVGGLESSALLENLAALWIHMLRSGMGRDMAFKLLRK